MSQATAYEQFMLELVNAERAKVGAQPLAFNGDLNESADSHSNWMIAADIFSHTGSGGSTPTQRMKSAGYTFSGSWSSAENIAWASVRAPSGYQDEVQLLHTNLMNSPGHKANILNGSFREIGVGFQTGEYKGWTGGFATQNFALSGSKVFLTGVAFDSRDGDRAYDVGEGVGGITVTAVSSTGAKFTTTTQSAGGYSLALAAGTYTVTFSGAGMTPVTKQVTIGTKNVKVDVINPGASGTAEWTESAKTISGTASNNKLSGSADADLIKGKGGNDRLYGKEGADKLYGGSGSDKLYGAGGDDFLFGSSGKDKLSGGEGVDHLYGGSGKDVLSGGAGNDYLKGGAGADAFCFRGLWGDDTVADFKNGVDRIDLRKNDLSFSKLSISQIDADKDGRIDDVSIAAGDQSITLLNLKASVVGSSDFLF